MSATTTVIIAIIVPLLLSAFFNFYGNRPWILYFPLLAILLGTGYAGHRYINSFSGRWISFALLAIGLSIVAYVGHRCIESVGTYELPFFSAVKEAEIASVDSDPMASRWWCKYEQANPPLRFPVTNLVHIAFTNLRPGPLMISSYSVEVRLESGRWWHRWKKMTRVPARQRIVFYVVDGFERASTMDFEGIFDELVSGQRISAGDTVRGWMFLEAPKGFAGKRLEWRLRVRDVRNVQSVRDFTPAPAGGEPYEEMLWATVTKKEDQDISATTPVLYSDFHWR